MNIKKNYQWSLMFFIVSNFSLVTNVLPQTNTHKNHSNIESYDDIKNIETKIEALEKQHQEKEDFLNKNYEEKSQKTLNKLNNQINNLQEAIEEQKKILLKIEEKIHKKLKSLESEEAYYQKEIQEMEKNLESLKKVNKDSKDINVKKKIELMMNKLNDKINEYNFNKHKKSMEIFNLKIKQSSLKNYINEKEYTISNYKNKIQTSLSDLQNNMIKKKQNLQNKFGKKISDLKNYIKDKTKNIEIRSPIAVKKN
jgi:DNA repair exonuclease SbcCD ATPase subunit